MELVRLMATAVVLGVVLVVPGLAWTYVLVAGARDMGWGSRLAHAVGLSMVIVPLAVFWPSLTLGMPVTPVTTAVVVAVVTVAPVGYLVWKRRQYGRGGGPMAGS